MYNACAVAGNMVEMERIFISFSCYPHFIPACFDILVILLHSHCLVFLSFLFRSSFFPFLLIINVHVYVMVQRLSQVFTTDNHSLFSLCQTRIIPRCLSQKPENPCRINTWITLPSRVSSQLTYYILKYALKCEPAGTAGVQFSGYLNNQ